MAMQALASPFLNHMQRKTVIRLDLVRLSDTSWICSSCAGNISRRRTFARNILQSRRDYSHEARQRRDAKLPSGPARTRFAPSPTGYMHIGGLRTALFSYLLAKATGGKFILRIEDTDQKRFVQGALERLCADLQWAGLQWDEGPQVGGEFGPYQQSHRTEIYQRHAQDLLDSGAAYRCFCTAQTAGVGSQAFVTSGCYQSCESASKEESSSKSITQQYTVRLKQQPDRTARKYPDLIYGNIKRLKRTPGAVSTGSDEAADPSDTILLKSDGTPTYHFANVVDDHLMQITHVIRGTEWMASTPLHYDLYHAFGWQPPVFAHVGLLLDQNKAKLSKRNADLALDVQGLRDEHDILPESLCNFLALQGWRNPLKSDVMDMQELIRNFDLKFTKGNTVVGMEKLWFLQRNHFQRRCDLAKKQGMTEYLKPLIKKMAAIVQEQHPLFKPPHGMSLNDLCSVMLLIDSRSFRDPQQFVDRNSYIFDFQPGQVNPDDDQDQTDQIIAQIFNDSKLQEAAMLPENLNDIQWYNALDTAHLMLNKILGRHLWGHVLKDEAPIELADALVSREDDSEVAKITQSSAEDVADLLKKYQTVQKAALKRLRQRLCNGLPGPSITYIIALEGVDECRTRLGLH